MSAFSNPIVLGKSNQAVVLERVPLNKASEGLFSEKFLQEALFANPQCLPVREIDPHIGLLIPICMEIETGAGPADILYVTPTGQLVIVETKLFRNPESRREVVAQILDYAKQLTDWTYEDLAREAAAATKKGPDYLPGLLESNGIKDEKLAAFVDGVNRSLSTGDFLLLIVGDGIRFGAESLVGFIERYGNLRFGLGLVEVAAFKLPNGELLMHPRILAKTEILQRTVLIGHASAVEFEQAAISEDAETLKTSDAPWFQAFWTEYMAALRLDDPLQPLPNLPKSTNIYFPMPLNGGAAWISAFIARSAAKGGTYLTFARAFDKAEEYFDRLSAQREEIERSFGAPLLWERDGNKFSVSAPGVPFGDLNAPADRARVIAHLVDMTNRMVNVFRHRLEALGRENG